MDFNSFLSGSTPANEFLFTPAVTNGGKATVVERFVGQKQTNERQSESDGVEKVVQSKVAADSCENRYNMRSIKFICLCTGNGR